MSDRRPSPDELLRRVEAEERIALRGRLKIFLGYAPRVGKSRRMIEEGVRRKKRGQDVVIGALQAKGADALQDIVGGLEIVADGKLDLAAIQERKPHVCLIDELAVRNPAGGRHEFRWQDVEELLESGISVLTAVNLQHVEERQDTIEQICGRRAEDSIPEHVIRSADEIVVVDAPLAHCSEPGEADRLSAMREIALLLAAEVIEAQVQRYLDSNGIRQSWGLQERILLCLTPRSNARAMIESGARNAQRFHGQLFALYVGQKDLSRELQETLEANLDLAQRLGAEVHRIAEAEPIDAILKFAQGHRITQIFAGHSQRPSWKFWGHNPLERLIQGAEGINVRLFPQHRPS